MMDNSLKFSEYREKYKLYRNTRLSNYEYQEKMSKYNNKYVKLLLYK